MTRKEDAHAAKQAKEKAKADKTNKPGGKKPKRQLKRETKS